MENVRDIYSDSGGLSTCRIRKRTSTDEYCAIIDTHMIQCMKGVPNCLDVTTKLKRELNAASHTTYKALLRHTNWPVRAHLQGGELTGCFQ